MVKYGNMPELLPWHHMPAQDVLFAFKSSKDGLTAAEAAERLKEYGPNQLRAEEGTPLGRIFLRQISNPLVFVLAMAVVLSMSLGRYVDGALTLVVMLMNALLGFFQEYHAERSLQALKKFLPAEVSLRRAGHVITLPVSGVVPGDILLISTGMQIPADARVILAKDVGVNESSLTGESAEVMKQVQPVAVGAMMTEQSSMVFAGSTLISGRLEAIVVATGKATQFGRVTEMVVSAGDEQTPLQVELRRLARVLLWIMIAAAVLVFVIGLVRGLPWVEILSTSAALAVAAVPEGLLVSVTVILTVGMRRMLKRQALVRRLVAAETLGSVNVLCIDKTGTLTTGEMEVVELHRGTARMSLASIHADDLTVLRDLRLVNVARVEDSSSPIPKIIGSATESSILRFLLKHKDLIDLNSAEVVDELPFNSDNKYSATLIRENGTERMLVMGAPDILLTHCDLSDREVQGYRQTLEEMTGRGLRVLLLAGKPMPANLRLTSASLVDLKPIGLIGLQDPARPHAKQTLAEARQAGIRVIMITGDHPETAEAVANELDLVTTHATMLLGSELMNLSDAELLNRLRTVTVCARILPEQKLRIVRGLQSLGATVAMTGDGVNDAPALRASDIGVAVGSGTEAAKESADMIILDNDVRTLVAAVREGRIIFDNIRKVITHLLTFSMSELGLIALIIVLGLPVPFWPLHILWINLVTDGLPSLALAFEPGEPKIMREPPRSRHTPILTPSMRRMMIAVGLMAISSLLILDIGFTRTGLSIETVRTLLFVSLGLDSLSAIFPLRSLRQPFWKIRLLHNPQLLGAMMLGFGLLVLPIFQSDLRAIFELSWLTASQWGLVFGLMLIKLLLIEVAKLWFLVDIRKANQMLIS